MHTYRFGFPKFDLHLLIDADTIFDALAEFTLLHGGSVLDKLDELHITKIEK